MLACGFSKIPKGLDLAISGGSGHRLATPELPPGTDIQIRTSAFLDFRRLYPRLRTWMAPPGNVSIDPKATYGL